MFKTNFKVAWRSLWKHKAYSFINIIGLTTGLTACLIVATVVIDELSYDHQWSKGDDIYRVLSINPNVNGDEYQPMAFSGLGPSLKKDMPEVDNYCRMAVGTSRLQLTGEQEGISFKVLRAEPTLFGVLDVKVLQGSPQKFVKGYTNLLINKEIKDKYFAGQNPVGKMITTVPEWGDPQKFMITGVIEKLPQNSHLRADIVTITEHRAADNAMPTSDGYTFEPQYIVLKPGTNAAGFERKVNKWYNNYFNGKKPDYQFHLQPMKDVYLKSDFPAVQSVHGSIKTVYIFSAVAAMLLIIACINFVNLTISRVFNRAKETGVRKVLGAGKAQLLIRFLAESVLFFVISFSLSMALYPLLLKPVETYLGHGLVINLYNSAFLLITIVVVLAISFVTGLYPAWYLSKPKPAVILKDKIASNLNLSFLKKALVVGQFAISVCIIIVTIVVHSQLNFMSTTDLGFDKNNLLNIDYTNWGKSADAFKQQVKQIPGVQGASITNWYPTSGAGNMSSTIPVGNQKLDVFTIQADVDMPAVLKLRLKQGRLFDPTLHDAIDADTIMSGGSTPQTKAQLQAQPLLVTDYTAALLDMKLNINPTKLKGLPVGIIKNFYSQSLHNKIKPTVIQALEKPTFGAMLIRVTPGTERTVLTKLGQLYKQYYPAKSFDYKWVNELVDEQYKAEFKLQQLFTCFSLLIIFLACLGLFGLVSFTAEQRLKEIGIRKVLGATVVDIVGLISKDYLWLVMAAIIIASPIAYYAMSLWLQDFAYRITMPWWVFAAGGLLAVLISFFTVSIQSVKAALANPVKSLRSE